MRVGWCPITLVCLLLLVIAAGCGKRPPSGPPAPETITFDSADGVQLGGTLYATSKPNPPGLVLVHMLGSDRDSWRPFAVRAQRAGFMCLALDLRGHGDSTRRKGPRLTYRSFDHNDWLATLRDIDAAKRLLLDRGVDPGNLALIGASIGANLVLHYGLDHTDIQAVVMISPGLDYKGVTTQSEIVEFNTRPVLLMTSKDDSYSAASAATLKRLAPGFCELREYNGAAHGTDLFATVPSVTNQILLWLRPIVGPKRPAP